MRRAGLLFLAVVALIAVIAAPFLISRMGEDKLLPPADDARGGVAHVVHATGAPAGLQATAE